MKISGITIAYRAVENGYPLAESLRSMLPLCDEVIANVGVSDDGTREVIDGIGSPKVRLVEEAWDLSLREKGLLLSHETNRAMDAATGDWIVYLQADEVLHERDLEPLPALLRPPALRAGQSVGLVHERGPRRAPRSRDPVRGRCAQVPPFR